jgi:hypothetical protein
MPLKPTPPTRFNTSYECELPEDVWRELGKPKRAAILRRPPVPEHSGIWKWIGAFALTVIILAGVIGHYAQWVSTTGGKPQPSAAIAKPTPAPMPTQPVSWPPV